MKVLHIDSSVLNDNSASRKLSARIVEQIRSTHAHVEVSYRDLAAQAPAHLSAEILATRMVPEAQWNDTQRAEATLTAELQKELFAADTIVIGAPMYNFGIPTQLRAWIDRVAQPGVTFQYVNGSPTGMVTGKQVIIASSRGGVYSTSEQMRAMDFQEDYLRVVLGLLGLKDVTIVRAEGLAMGDAVRDKAFQAAEGTIATLYKLAA